MRKNYSVFLILVFILFVNIVWAEENGEKEDALPPGMKMEKVGDLEILVPEGAKVERTGKGGLISVESTEKYVARELAEIKKRFEKIEKKYEELKKEVQELKEVINKSNEKKLISR